MKRTKADKKEGKEKEKTTYGRMKKERSKRGTGSKRGRAE